MSSSALQVPSVRRLRSHRVQLSWDCLSLVFEECDAPTLAILGRVSLDFLKATVPLLYDKVEIKSFKGLNRLFCDRQVSL